MTTTRATPFAGSAPLTDAQRRAVLGDGDLLLAAGAGSGKTTTLVAKIVHLLGAERIDGERVARPCELSEIAAVTFTNAAAADLRRKLRAALRKVADWHAERGDTAEERRWRERVYEVDRARIGTIHSFCGQLLRELALRLGLDPAFAVLDDAESALLRTECARAVLREALREQGAADLAAALGLSGAETLIADLAARGEVVAESLAAWFDGAEPRLEALRRAVEAQRAGWGCADGEGEWRERADTLAARLAGTALDLAVRTRRAMDERLDAEGALDFDALITRTRDALRDRADVREALGRRLAWLFVDEFQDTDRAQLEIAYLATGFGAAAAERPRTRLCVVGDPKQSIYRFRRADVSLWKRVEEDFARAGIAPIPLAENFRSRAPIVGYVNATFAGLIGVAPRAVLDSGHEVDYAPLEHRRTAPRDDGLVELLASGGAGKANELREAEAESIVARIAAMMREEEPVVWEDDEQRFRTIEWRDVAILFRTRTALPVFEPVLRRHGVPYYVAGGSGFYARREVRDVRLLLAAMADSHDDVAWMGVLRGPWVGVTDETILRHRARHPAAPLSSILGAGGEVGDADALGRAQAWLPVLHELRDRVSVAELIDFALERSGYAAQWLTQEGGELAVANLRKLVRIAEGRPEATVSDFLDFMREREHGDARDADAAVYTAGENVVTLSTVHGAKGLEWPVVFLVDLDRDLLSERKKPRLIADPAAGVALRFEEPASRGDDAQASGAFECLYRREQALSLAEEKRLWYVAATRARDRLVLCASAEDAIATAAAEEAETAKHWLLRALAPEEDYFAYEHGGTRHLAGEVMLPRLTPPTPPAFAIPAVTALASAPPAPERVRARWATLDAPVRLPRRSATELMSLAADPAEHATRYGFGVPERRVFARTGARTPTGVAANVLGDVLHGALEQLRSDDDLDAYLESELMERLGEAPGSERVSAAVLHLRGLVEQSRTHPAVARLYDAPGAERELAFTWFARGAGGTTLMRGAMDLVARVDGALEILDYKSHAISAGEEEATAKGYDVQVAVYTAALASLTGTAPAKFSFFFPATGGVAERALAVDDAEKRVAKLLGGIR